MKKICLACGREHEERYFVKKKTKHGYRMVCCECTANTIMRTFNLPDRSRHRVMSTLEQTHRKHTKRWKNGKALDYFNALLKELQ